jgi:hypothetical protein
MTLCAHEKGHSEHEFEVLLELMYMTLAHVDDHVFPLSEILDLEMRERSLVCQVRISL